MSKSPTQVLEELNRKRSRWLETTRENEFEDGILNLLSDLYPDQAHFVFELLQNAEDAQATKVQFHLLKDKLVVKHNGKRLFGPGDVEGITSIGKSTKKDEVNKIGKFGIGFKAVFAYSNTPQVHSVDYNFEIRDLVCPYELGGANGADDETLFILPFNCASKKPEICFSEIRAVFSRLDHSVMLFLRHIESISWEVEGKKSGRVQRSSLSSVDPHLVRVDVFDSVHDQQPEEAYFFRFEKELEEYGDLHCSIAIKLDFRGKERRKLDENVSLSKQLKVIPAEGTLSVFFPAEKESTGLKFYLNGPYAATIDRASIKHGHPDNKRILNASIELLVDGLHHLKKIGMLTSEALGFLPIQDDQLPPFYAQVRESIYAVLKEQDLLPTLSGDYVCAEKLNVGLKSITDVVDDEAFEILNDQVGTKWAAGVMQNRRSGFLLDSLDIPNWGFEDLCDLMQMNFTQHDVDESASEWLQGKNSEFLRKFYMLISSATRRIGFEDYIQYWEIIKLSSGEFCAGDEVYFPATGSAKNSDFKTVEPSLFEGVSKEKKQSLHDFLKLAGVREIGEKEELKLLLDTYYAEDKECDISETMHLDHIRRFIKWFNEEKQAEIFADYTILKDSSGDYYCTPSSCYIDRPLVETGLSAVYGGTIEEPRFDDLGFKFSLWRGYSTVKGFEKFAIACGVIAKLEIEGSSIYLNSRHSELLEGTYGARETYTGIRSDYAISSLKSLMRSKSIEIARLIWRTVSEASPSSLKARYRPNQQYRTRVVPSQFIQELSSGQWIPDRKGNFRSPQEMTAKQLRDDFDYDDRNGWLTAIGFGANEEKATKANRQKKDHANKLGFSVGDVDFLKKLKKDKKLYSEFKSQLEANFSNSQFPEKPSPNFELRRDKAAQRAQVAQAKKYESRNRRVKTTQPDLDARTYLKNNYTNEESHLICQMCEKEMPFKLRSNEYYYEAVQLLNELKGEYTEAHLALCPLCSAKYKELVKKDPKEVKKLRRQLEKANLEKPLRFDIDLYNQKGTLRFVQRHLVDVQAILQQKDP